MTQDEFNALLANAIIGQGNQVDLGGVLPKLLLNLFKNRGMPYSVKKKFEPYLYEFDYENIDYAFAKDWFDRHYVSSGCKCSIVAVDGFVGRNLDEVYDDSITGLVRVAPSEGTYGSIGLVSGFTSLVKPLIESGEYDDVLKVLPFVISDAVNSEGLFCGVNILNREKGWTKGTIPAVEQRDRIAMPMLVRYIVDHYASVDDAIDGITDYVSVYAKAGEVFNSEYHYLLKDDSKTVILEFVDNAVYTREVGEGADYPSAMFNFFVNGVTLNNDDTITRNTDSGENQNGVTPFGQGIERHNIVIDGLSGITDVETMKSMMRSLFYTNAYTETENPWYTEFVGINDLKVTSPADDFAEILEKAREAYENRMRDGKTWQTIHSVVYNLNDKSLSVCVQEGETYHDFIFGESADVEAVVGDVADLHTTAKQIVGAINELADKPTILMLQSENDTTVGGYSVPSLTVEQVTQAYNAVVSGRGCIIIDHNETMHAYVNQADKLNDELSIAILFYSSMILTYTISDNAVVITHIEL